MSLSTLASEKWKATTQTITNLNQLLDYIGTHPDATIWYYASDTIINVHSNAYNLSEKYAQIRATGHFFLGWTPKDSNPAHLNGAIFIIYTILKFIAVSAAKAKLDALFLDVKKKRLMLHELDHIQPPTPIHWDNTMSEGIANGTVKRQRS